MIEAGDKWGGDTDMQSDHFQGRIVHVHINFVSIEKNRIAVIYFSVFFTLCEQYF